MNIKAAVISSLTELCIIHPIDVYKTMYQQKNIKLTNFIKLPIKQKYYGFKFKSIALTPMRTSFWLSQNYLNKHYKNKYITSIGSALCQSLFDVPIENYKISKINNFKKINFFNAFSYQYYRNLIFIYCLQTSNDYITNNFYSGLIGGLTGAVLSHPFDYIKTMKQSYLSVNYKYIYKGITIRTFIAMLSMGIGNFIFNSLKVQ